MIRKQIYLPEQMNARLKAIAFDKGISFAEVLRRIIDEYFVGRHTTRVETENAPTLTQADESSVVGES